MQLNPETGTIPPTAGQHLAKAVGHVAFRGRAVLDIGCGTGEFLRLLLAQGADATGLEVDPNTIRRAIDAGSDPARLVLGDGSTLPFGDALFDLVTFVYSFHHVPGAVQRPLLTEVARVLRPGGTLLAFDPRPYGEMTDVIRPLEDETEVRTRAQALLCDPPEPFRLRLSEDYDTLRAVSDADALIRQLVTVDSARGERAERPGVREEIARRFAATGRQARSGRVLLQPTLMVILDMP